MLRRSASVTSQRISGDPNAVIRTQYSKAALARDDGLRLVRKITWWAGLLPVAAAAVIGAKFAHITAMLPHLSVGGSSSSSGSPSTGTCRPVLLVGDLVVLGGLVVLGRRRRHQRRLVSWRP
jgi:hypothetical protein